MKRFLTILATTLLLTAALCVSASASDFDAVAEDLSAIGMFRGTANGFELDRAPTRSEAAIMLVRLYGAEEEAAAAYASGEISHPFTDVSEFTSPYVAWLYTNGITNGYTATTFASQNPCTAQNYVVFLLRALGYKDGVDFEYAGAADFAVMKGLFTMSIYTGEFLRDDLAAVTYQALACKLADGSTYLLDSLIQSGAIDAEAAKPITEKIETYQALTDASNETIQNSLDTDIAMKMDMSFSLDGNSAGESMSMEGDIAITADGSIQMILDEEMEMGMVLDMLLDMKMTDADGAETTTKQPTSMGIWMKDGWIYVQEDEETAYKQKMDDSTASFMEMYQEIMNLSTQMTEVSVPMTMPYIGTISTEKKSGNTVYSMTFNEDAFMGLMGDILGMIFSELDEESLAVLDMLDISLEECGYTYTFNRSGQLKDVNATLGMTMGMDIPVDESSSAAIAITLDAEIDMVVNATGSKVKVDYPDLSKFRDIAEIEAELQAELEAAMEAAEAEPEPEPSIDDTTVA